MHSELRATATSEPTKGRPHRRPVVTHALPATLALCAPAVRMLVVFAWVDHETGDPMPDRDLPDHRLYPVLALVAKQEWHYSKFADGDLEAAPDHEPMEALGWHYDGSGDGFIDFDVVINDEDYGICEASLALADSGNGAFRIVTAPWDPAEDDEQLAPVIAELRSMASTRVRERRRSPNRPESAPAAT